MKVPEALRSKEMGEGGHNCIIETDFNNLRSRSNMAE